VAEIVCKEGNPAMPEEHSDHAADAVTSPPSGRQDPRRAVRPRRRRGNGPLERITVNVTRRASRALDLATKLTGDSKTDTVNRALQVYAYVEQVTADGGSVYVRAGANTELELLKVF
jgi:hypothetical protein